MPGIKEGEPIDSRVMMAVLFDPTTGHIAHYHRVHIFDSERQISQAHVEERARTLAARFGWDLTKLETLAVDAGKFKQGSRFKVHAGSRSLVEVPKTELQPKNLLRLRSAPR